MTESPKRPARALPRTPSNPNRRTPADLRAYADNLEANTREAAQRAYDSVLEEGMVEVRRIRSAADVVERLEQGAATREANAAAGGGDLVALPRPSALTSRNSYVTDDEMPSTQSLPKHPGPRAVKGPMAALAKELGLASLRELAEALAEEHQNVRSWNHRGSAPDRLTDKIAKLRAAHHCSKRAKK